MGVRRSGGDVQIDWGDVGPTPHERERTEQTLRLATGPNGSAFVGMTRRSEGFAASVTEPGRELWVAGPDLASVVDRAAGLLALAVRDELGRDHDLTPPS